MTKKSLYILAVICAYILLNTGLANATITCKISPQNIPISFFYNGTDVHISGHSNFIGDIVVVISDKPERLVLRRKEKVKGIFWMNVGEISFDPVPITYMVFTSRPLNKILSKDQIIKYGIGYTALMSRVKLEPDPGKDRIKWIKEFIHFKENLRLYRKELKAVKVDKTSQGENFSLSLHWPYQAPPGVYNLTVYLIQNQKVTETCFKTIRIEKVGLLKTISDLAFNRAAIYGVIAIIIAVVAGIGVGLIFGSKGEH